MQICASYTYMRKSFLFLCFIAGFYALVSLNWGCAQISAPTGGATDTLPPRLVKANPPMNSTNVKGNKISLSFNEYIDLQEVQNNMIISPVQKSNPTVSFNLKTISIKFKDSLLPNTTYSVDFGNALKDIHEGNVYKNFTYVFSTGNTIDSLTLSGNVLLAETGKADSTLMVLLYRNLADSAVQKTKPVYMTRVDGKGRFQFKHLPAEDFHIYALKDGDGGKTYNSKTELFAFSDENVNPAIAGKPVQLFAYYEQKPDNNNKTVSVLKAPAEKKLKYSNNLESGIQDLLQPLEFSFNNALKTFDSTKAVLLDTNFRPVQKYTYSIDSTQKKLTLNCSWQPETHFVFIMPKEAVLDSAGNSLSKSDTIRFVTKRTEDYGSVVLRFSNLDLSMHPVIQFGDDENVKLSFPVTEMQWTNKLFPPGDYSVKILFDENNNGKWDPGNYSKKMQPEKVLNLDMKLSVKANWDNERDIKL